MTAQSPWSFSRDRTIAEQDGRTKPLALQRRLLLSLALHSSLLQVSRGLLRRPLSPPPRGKLELHSSYLLCLSPTHQLCPTIPQAWEGWFPFPFLCHWADAHYAHPSFSSSPLPSLLCVHTLVHPWPRSWPSCILSSILPAPSLLLMEVWSSGNELTWKMMWDLLNRITRDRTWAKGLLFFFFFKLPLDPALHLESTIHLPRYSQHVPVRLSVSSPSKLCYTTSLWPRLSAHLILLLQLLTNYHCGSVLLLLSCDTKCSQNNRLVCVMAWALEMKNY